jgi:antitoxin component YwqK of YwqJK toxin-antitoxin module
LAILTRFGIKAGVAQAKMRTEHKPYPYRLVTEWYENGQKKLEFNYKDGNRHGLAVWWYENGEEVE